MLCLYQIYNMENHVIDVEEGVDVELVDPNYAQYEPVALPPSLIPFPANFAPLNLRDILNEDVEMRVSRIILLLSQLNLELMTVQLAIEVALIRNDYEVYQSDLFNNILNRTVRHLFIGTNYMVPQRLVLDGPADVLLRLGDVIDALQNFNENAYMGVEYTFTNETDSDDTEINTSDDDDLPLH